MNPEDIIGYIETGERPRPPRVGDWYVTDDGKGLVLCGADRAVSRRIMRPIPRGSVVIEPGMVAQLRQFLVGAGVDPKDPALLSRLLAAIDAQTAPPKPVPAPCPECGGRTFCDIAPSTLRRVRCNNHECDVRGPWKPNEAEATESWNRFAKGGAS